MLTGSQVSWDSAHLSWDQGAALLQVVNLTGRDSLLQVVLSSIPCVFILGSRLKGQQLPGQALLLVMHKRASPST